MTSSLFLSFLSVSVLIVFASAGDAFLAAACRRNPTLAMCSSSLRARAGFLFRAKDAPEDDDNNDERTENGNLLSTDIGDRVDMGSIVQLERYCMRHQRHYFHYCASPTVFALNVRAKLFTFCPTYEKFCPDVVGDHSGGGVIATPPPMPSPGNVLPELIMPPSLPSSLGDSRRAHDLPLPSDDKPAAAPRSVLHVQPAPNMNSPCTPDCTAPHCTNECKCRYSFPKMHLNCNPPPNAEVREICKQFYRMCPMFHELRY